MWDGSPGPVPGLFRVCEASWHGSSPRLHDLSPRAQPRREIGQPPHGAHIADGEGAGLRLPDEDDELLAACDTGVEEIATQHGVVLGRQSFYFALT